MANLIQKSARHFDDTIPFVIISEDITNIDELIMLLDNSDSMGPPNSFVAGTRIVDFPDSVQPCSFGGNNFNRSDIQALTPNPRGSSHSLPRARPNNYHSSFNNQNSSHMKIRVT